MAGSPDGLGEHITLAAGETLHLHGAMKVASIDGDGIVAMSGHSHVGQVGGNVTVTGMTGRSRIETLTDAAEVGVLAGRAQIGTVGGNATVGDVHERGRIGTVTDNARISYVHAPAKVDAVTGDARIEGRAAAARIGPVTGNAHVAPRTKSKKATTNKEAATLRGHAPRIGRQVTSTSRLAHRFVRGEIDRELAVARGLAADAVGHETRH